jgi:hypothetical protein
VTEVPSSGSTCPLNEPPTTISRDPLGGGEGCAGLSAETKDYRPERTNGERERNIFKDVLESVKTCELIFFELGRRPDEVLS